MREIKTTLDFKKVGRGIKTLRGSESQTDFGKRYGMTKGQVGHVENGIRKPSIIFLWDLHIEKNRPLEFILSGGELPRLSKKTRKEKLGLNETKICLRTLAKNIEDLFGRI